MLKELNFQKRLVDMATSFHLVVFQRINEDLIKVTVAGEFIGDLKREKWKWIFNNRKWKTLKEAEGFISEHFKRPAKEN